LLEEIRAAGFVEGLKAAGFALQEAVAAGFSRSEFSRAGYTLDDVNTRRRSLASRPRRRATRARR